MFTGIVEDIGTVAQKTPRSRGASLVIGTTISLEHSKPGDSIAVCGVCLTAVEVRSKQFSCEMSRETLQRSVLGQLRPGDRVHLERAVRPIDRLDGHLVQGHVDGTGQIQRRTENGDSLQLDIIAPSSLHKYLIEKGSIAVHGVSLTINTILPDGFSVTLVPFTRSKTLLGELRIGTGVNLEVDVIGKYVERLLSFSTQQDRNPGEASSLHRLLRLEEPR